MSKLPITAREEIFNQFKQGEHSNQKIVNVIKKKFGASCSSAYISQLRKTRNIQQLTLATRDVEKKIKEKLKIDANMLEIAREFTEIGKSWLIANREDTDSFSAKDIAMVMTAFHKLFKSFQETSGSVEKQEDIQTEIHLLDKQAEMEGK